MFRGSCAVIADQLGSQRAQNRKTGLRFVLLALLTSGPNTGYGLSRLLSTELKYAWQAKIQRIYSELPELVKEGLIARTVQEVVNRPATKVYALTAAGEAELERWLAQGPYSVHRDDLVVRLMCLEWAGPAVLIRHAQERLHERNERISALEALVEQYRSSTRGTIAKRLTLEAELLHTQADADWCKRALSLLGHIQADEREDAPSRRTERP